MYISFWGDGGIFPPKIPPQSGHLPFPIHQQDLPCHTTTTNPWMMKTSSKACEATKQYPRAVQHTQRKTLFALFYIYVLTGAQDGCGITRV